MPRPNQVGGTYTQTRTFVYDLTTSWLSSSTNPENGTTTYNYLANGQLNYKLDAKGQKLEYTYDTYSRVTKITPRETIVSPATEGKIAACDVVEYFYDLTQNTWGRLSAVQWGSKALNPDFPFGPLCAKGLHREEYTYTNGGRTTSKTLKLTRVFPDINNEERTAQMAIAYDYTNGQYPYQLSSPTLTKVTYPSTHTQAAFQQPVLPLAGAIYQYTYDSQGRPTGETRQDPNASPVSIVDQVTYNTFGALTQMRQTLVSKTETRAYDSFQRMTSMTTFDGTAIAYNYSQTANDGKLVSQVTGGETVNYTYDVLGRLSQAATAGAGGWGMSWTYDGWGNRLQQSAVKGAVPTMVSITDPATNRIQAHTYDANGNTVNTPQQGAMTYDVINRLKTVAADTYGYDPSNKRIWKNDEYTFWGAAGERIGRYSAVKLVNDVGTHVFVFQKVQVDEYFGGRRLTSQDRLGSVGSYYPYGEAKSGTVSNADAFATYYRDSTGFDYAQQRYYSSGSGRFLTPDPAGSGSNWHAYVSGDPVNGLDPKGLNLQGPPDSDSGVCEAQFSSCGPGIGARGGGGGGGNWDYSGGYGAGSFASAGYCFPLPIPIVIYESPVPPPSCGAQLVIAVRNFLTLRMPSLVPYAGAIAATGASYNIDPRLIAAMAVAENGQATNNPFGLGPNGSTAFASIGAALAQLGRTLDIYIYRWNETSVSQLWSGNTWKVEPKKPWITTQYPGYCVGTSAEAQAGCQATGNNISGFMTSMSGNPNQLGYPCPD